MVPRLAGSTSGIGLGIAAALAEAGANVMLNGFGDAQAIEPRCADSPSVGRRRCAIPAADMSKRARSRRWSRRRGALRPGRHPGQQRRHPARGPDRGVPAEKWDAILAINLSAAFPRHPRRRCPDEERGWGRIVNIASAHGLVASPFKSAYVAAKHGMVGLTKVAALETAEGITCNAICPGYVWTPLVEKQIDDQAKSHGIPREQVIRDVLLEERSPTSASRPSRRWARWPCSCAREAAASITGAALPVDGGWTAH